MKAHGPTHQHDKKSIFEFLPGPVKIKDGLFMGDEIAARVQKKLSRTLSSSSAIR